jgi:hypothetical protein
LLLTHSTLDVVMTTEMEPSQCYIMFHISVDTCLPVVPDKGGTLTIMQQVFPYSVQNTMQ